MMFEVIEPNWHTMMERLKTVKTIDDVIWHHDHFLDTCMKECMLHNPQLLKILTKLMSTCIIFSNHTDRFTKTLTLDLERPFADSDAAMAISPRDMGDDAVRRQVEDRALRNQVYAIRCLC